MIARLRGSPRARCVVLALTSALVSRACCPPFDLAPLAFVAWLPLLIVLERVSWLEGALFGLLQGVVTNLLAFCWMTGALHDVAGLSWPASLSALGLLSAWQGLRVCLLGALYRAVVVRAGRLRPLAFAALLAAVESSFPMAFPWASHGFLHAAPIWAQLASIGGAALVSASIGFVNEALLAALHAPRRSWSSLSPALASVAALTGYGWGRMRSVDAELAGARRSQVLVVQGNLLPARLERRDPATVYRDATLAALARHPEAQWVAWPETAVFYGTAADQLPQLFRDVLLRDAARGVRAPSIERPLVTGLVVDEASAQFNSVVAAQASGALSGRYDKRLLVPLGETRGRGAGEPAFAARTGEQAPLLVDGHAIAAVICFEALDDERVREAMSGGRAELLLNPTSDAWFAGTIGPRMHLAFASIRAIEHERYLLRPTTTGTTALIDPAGRQIWRLAEGQAAAGIAQFSWLEPVTVFTRHGPRPFRFGFAALSAVFAIFAAVAGRRTAGEQRSGAV